MKSTQLHWEAFWAWIREKGLVGSGSEKRYQSAFRDAFGSVCQADLVMVYEAYRHAFDQNDNSILISMYGSYLQYRLELDGQPAEAVPARMTLLKELFQAAKKKSVDLDQLLDRITRIGGIKKSGFLQADAFRTPKGKLTPDGFYYYAQRHVLLELKRELHLRGTAAADMAEMLRQCCPEEHELRKRLYGFAELLTERWGDRPGFAQSGTQQKLLQLLSLRSPLWKTGEADPGRAYAGLCRYAAELLLDLSADLYASNGAAFGSPVIPMESDAHYWIWLLVLAPFQRIGHMTQEFFLARDNSADEDSRILSTHYMRLIRNGLLWISYPPRAVTPQIKLVPCAYRLLVDKDTKHPELLWKMQGKNASDADRRDASEMALLRNLLRRLCSGLTQLQILNAKSLDQEQLCTLELFKPSDELALILASAPRTDERHRSTISALLQVQFGCCWIQSLSRDPERINTACIQLRELADTWGDSVADIAASGKLPFVRWTCGLQSISARLRMHHAQRILEVLYGEDREKPTRNGTKFAIFAEQSARECLAAARRENNGRELIRSACAQLRARLYQLTHMGAYPVSRASVVLDYLLPAWQLLRQGRTQLLMEQIGAEYHAILSAGSRCSGSRNDPTEQHQEELAAAAALYNRVCDGFADMLGADVYALAGFDPNATLEEMERRADDLKACAEALIGEIRTADPARWTREPAGPAGGHRSFHQNWFLSDQDSVFVTNRANIELSKRHLMTHLLSAQNAVFTVNQIMDNRAIWELSQNPAFLWMVQRGKVGISLYGGIYDLVEYAAKQMLPPADPTREPFLWSSLPSSFNNCAAARQEAAEYLLGRRKASDLSLAFRDEIVFLGDRLRVLNEAISYDVRNRHFQRKAAPNMIAFMNHNYDWLEQQGHAPEVCLVHRRICDIIGTGGFRTDYKRQVELCRKPDGAGLTLEQGQLLELVNGFADPGAVIDKVEFLMNDLYNRMLANTFTQLADFSYTREQRQLLRYDETKPITEGGCVLYQQSYSQTATGTRIDWSGLVDRAAAQDEILRLHPEIRPEDMVRILADDAVEYDIRESADGSILRTGRVVLRTDDTDGSTVVAELLKAERIDDRETIHMETGKEEHK